MPELADGQVRSAPKASPLRIPIETPTTGIGCGRVTVSPPAALDAGGLAAVAEVRRVVDVKAVLCRRSGG